jgi:hypothetical protein
MRAWGAGRSSRETALCASILDVRRLGLAPHAGGNDTACVEPPRTPQEPTMKTPQRLTGLALAMLLTLSMLVGIDRLAHTEFAAAVSAQTVAQTPAAAGAVRV